MERMPVFVKVPDDITLKDIILQARARIELAHAGLRRIEALSKEESARINDWKTSFDAINQRIEKIKKLVLQPAG